jgi:hypothetical protein
VTITAKSYRNRHCGKVLIGDYLKKSKSCNKLSVGEPAEGSLPDQKDLETFSKKFCLDIGLVNLASILLESSLTRGTKFFQKIFLSLLVKLTQRAYCWSPA